MGEPTMTEYRIVEHHRKFWIEEQLVNKSWTPVSYTHVPRYFDSIADARSWVATIKRGVVYHDAEDAPNLAQDERKAEDDTSDGIKPLEWFEERIDDTIIQIETTKNTAWISDYGIAKAFHRFQTERGYRYKDQ
jgi:hypothetical protein